MKKIDNKISNNSNIENSNLGNGVVVYDNVEIRDSDLGDLIKIGDHSIILESKLLSNISLNRRNFIQQSEIGKFTYTGFNTVIRAVKIGKFCSISWNVSIGGKEHNIENVTTSAIWGFHNMNGTKMESKFNYAENQQPCIIENDVLISANVVILRGVTIGNGAVIGAGAVVTKDVEPYSVVAGVPAKKIKMRFDNDTIKILEQINWWDWPNKVIEENLDLIYASKVDAKVLQKLKEIADSISNE